MRVTVERIQALMSFGGKDPASRATTSKAMVRQQTEGVAALCAILQKQPFAYLADEVGLGKTVQAIGVAAWFRHKNENSRILVITPREVIQRGWVTEFEMFVSNIWCGAPEALGKELTLHHRLTHWLANSRETTGISLLRHPSFMRPLHATDERKDWHSLLQGTGLVLPKKWLDNEPALSGQDRGWAYNVHFAKLMNRWMREQDVRFDLVIVDEAQCLRRENQSNTVLHTLLKGLVDKWLFVSATPAHSGIETIRNVITKYPEGCSNLLGSDVLDDTEQHKELLRVLSRHMIRRMRCYDIGGSLWTKAQYRQDLPEAMAYSSNDSALGALSVALVQKKLVEIVADEGRFQAGYLASFESLDASLETRRQRKTAQLVEAADPRTVQEEDDPLAGDDDHYQDRNHREKSSAIDSAFVSHLSRRFAAKFDPLALPHPKIDAVTKALSAAAFGDGAQPGGVKTLVFCRRLSTVDTLRNRLMARYLQWIAARVQRKWKRELDWDLGKLGYEPDDDEMGDSDDATNVIDVTLSDETDLLRKALRPGKWLYNFRATFDDGGSNALFFEPNWFVRLCEEGGVSLSGAISRIPPEIWAEAHSYCHKSGKRLKRLQLRYLTLHSLDRDGQRIFGLSETQVEAWKEILTNVFGHIGKAEKDTSTTDHIDPELPAFQSVWTRWRKVESLLGAKLPGGAGEADATTIEGREAIYWRQGLTSVMTKYMRMTDTLVDLYYCADKKRNQSLLDEFMQWLQDNDADAAALRKVLGAWMKSYRTIFRSSLHNLTAKQASECDRRFDFLDSLNPVVGVVGGGDHSRLIRQFNTPGMPWVVVATDCMREGVNLHLFCDRVMHYGVAWTAGDLEQRVGRVDRYFSLLERRLYEAAASNDAALPNIKLNIFYPHLRDTLERRQIEEVLRKKKVVDDLMGSPLQDASTERMSIDLDGPAVQAAAPAVQVSRDQFDPAQHLRR